jgi:DNA modification methylase
MRSPKLVAASAKDRYYRYYAGYTLGFVEDMLDFLGADDTTVIADPWNGSGTTTTAAASRGIKANGFDINPAAVLIGRSQLLAEDIVDSLVPLGAEIYEHSRAHPSEMRDDPLSIWFGPDTMRGIRSIERAIHTVLVPDENSLDSATVDPLLPQSPLAAVFYVALFQAVRQLAHRYVPSNPAWIKSPTGRRVGMQSVQLQQIFATSVQRLANHLTKPERAVAAGQNSPRVRLASSTELPLPDTSVDAVISSPPYCTRLDYVKATLPELAVLGIQEPEIRRLRDQMIGTPTITNVTETLPHEAWGDKTNALLARIKGHESKASATYYRKYYLQYFTGMWDSLAELRRILKPGSPAVLVLQDSYYKDIHVDLATLIGDMSQAAGWTEWSRTNFIVPRTMASIHPGSRTYRQQVRTVESAIILKA